MKTFEAFNRFGRLVRTFGSKDQAEAYRERMAALGSEIEIKVARLVRKAA